MPELPEVETVVSSLIKGGIEKSLITDVKIIYSKCIDAPDFSDFSKLILNKKILKISRRGKYIIFSLSEGYFMLVHLKMTGRLTITDISKKEIKHEHIRFELDKKIILSFIDTRKFGKIFLTKNLNSKLEKLGPEPIDPHLDFNQIFSKILKSKKKIKALLLDQSILSGLGNIYADETLWEAKINPNKISLSLTLKEMKALLDSAKKVLLRGIKNKGTSLGRNAFNFADIYNHFGENQNFLNVYKQEKKPCKRCNSVITKEKIAQRSSYFCPSCQR